MDQNIVKALGPLGEIYSKEGVLEILVDARDDIYYEENGKTINSDIKFKNDEEMLKIIKDVFKLVGRDVSSVKTFADCRLSDGTRFMAVFPPMSVDGYRFNLMKMPHRTLSWEDLIKKDSVTKEGVDLFKDIVSQYKNLLVIGNVGSGKTTITNNIVELIPDEARVVVLEKNVELQLSRKRLVRLEAIENKVESIPDLIKAASLMRPDYIVFNEFLSEEAGDLIYLLRNGYSGVVTIHAENVKDGLKRLEMRFLAKNSAMEISDVREIIANTINYVTFQERLPDGKRKLSEISKIGLDESGDYRITPLYLFDKEREQFFLTSQKDSLHT
jgi:pilus assembly protein CpaF